MKPQIGQLYTLKCAATIEMFSPAHECRTITYIENTVLIYMGNYSADQSYSRDKGWHTILSQEHGAREVFVRSDGTGVEFISCK